LEPTPIPNTRRVPLPPAAVAALQSRRAAVQLAERDLNSCLTGVVSVLGIAPADVLGVDDVAGELVLRPLTKAE